MDRREFLATGASLTIAAAGGCTGCAAGPSASLRMDAVDDAAIAERATMRLEADEDNERYRIAADAVEEGSVTVDGTGPPFTANRSFVYEGGVYELRSEVMEERPATSFGFTLNPAEESVDAAETVRFEDLPAVDREKFAERGWAGDDPFLGFGSSLLYLDSEIPKSALVPEPERSVIVWDEDSRGRFTVDDSHETSLKTYQYEARTVNPSAADYGANIREEYAFTLEGLSEAEREIVTEAVDAEHGYQVPAEESLPDALRRLADRFRTQEEIHRAWDDSERDETSVSGDYVVAYDGAVYWTRVNVPNSTSTKTTRDG